MEQPKKVLIYGILIWLIPFVASFIFYRPDGTLVISQIFFKTIMILVGAPVGIYLAVRYLGALDKDYLKAGISIGLVWFVMSVVLDLIILLPMSGMGIAQYFQEIGLRYLIIPMITVGMGSVLESKTK